MKNECAINTFQVRLFEHVVADIPESALRSPGLGHGHTPLWLLGHLALVGGLGRQRLGDNVESSPEWGMAFGPGSPDPVSAEPQGISKEFLVAAIQKNYSALRDGYEKASADVLARPHGISLFRDTPIVTVDHAVALLLTNHFGFHLAQLSSVRRSLGKPPLF